LNHSTSPFFVMDFYQDRVSQTICHGWLLTAILLISASWVTRIKGMTISACFFFLKLKHLWTHL
jgi:ABC-type transport system involved in multi-copper enzyme maturation permease subunit